MKVFAATWLLAVATVSATAGDLNLIPWPAKVEEQTGRFVINTKTVITADTAFTNEATLLANELNLPDAEARTNRIWLTTQGARGLGNEAYQLEVNRQGVTIRAQSPAGAFYGCQTLRQLLEPKTQTIPFVKIEDAPHYAWRGLMLDESRHFFGEPTVLRLLDWMADYKLNRLHLHLTDDQAWRLEIAKYPALTQIGGRGNYSDSNAAPAFFTQSEMREIIHYAAQRHIVVVPEIETPGHAGAAVRAYPQLSGGENTFNPASAATYNFLQNVLLDVMNIFPSPWIHFGGDEVDYSHWQVTDKLKFQGVETPAQMDDYFVRRMAKFITQQGRTPMGWDEIVSARPPTNTVVFWWRHNQPEVLEQALADGYSVVLTPRSPCYFDYPQDESYPKTGWKLINTLAAVYAGPEIPATISASERKNILGVEGCVWTERISTVPYLEFMLLPRLAALGEMAWTPDAQRDFTQFDARLKPLFKQYRQAGLHYYDETDPQGSLRDARPTASLQSAATLPVFKN